MSKYISLSFYVYFSVVLPLPTAVSICKVGDCGLQIYQTEMKLKRATALGFTIITPILNIHCWTKSRSRGSSFEVKVVFLYFYEPHFKIFSSWKKKKCSHSGWASHVNCWWLRQSLQDASATFILKGQSQSTFGNYIRRNALISNHFSKLPDHINDDEPSRVEP